MTHGHQAIALRYAIGAIYAAMIGDVFELDFCLAEFTRIVRSECDERNPELLRHVAIR